MVKVGDSWISSEFWHEETGLQEKREGAATGNAEDHEKLRSTPLSSRRQAQMSLGHSSSLSASFRPYLALPTRNFNMHEGGRVPGYIAKA
jgi:hypothetical protein